MNYIASEDNLSPEVMALMDHDHNRDLFVAIRDTAFDIIKERMHPSFPHYLIDHSLQVASQTQRLLIDQGVAPNIARTLGENASLHDIGKAHITQIPFWFYTEDKSQRLPQSDFNKQQQKLHPLMGPAVLAEAYERLGIDPRDMRKEERMRFKVCEYMMTDHHKLTHPDMGFVIDILRTVDVVAGQLKTTHHDYGSAIHKIYKNTENKYTGQYNPRLLARLANINGVELDSVQATRPTLQN